MNINWNVIVRALAAAGSRATGRYCVGPDKHDPGHVPAGLMSRLCAVAEREGYAVKLTDLPSDEYSTILGSTQGYPKREVELQHSMSPASTFRTLAHETGHVLLGHAPTDEDAAYRMFFSRTGENPDEEAAVELGAGALCAALGIGTGRYTAEYLAQKLRGGLPSAQVMRQAAALAERMYQEVTA